MEVVLREKYLSVQDRRVAGENDRRSDNRLHARRRRAMVNSHRGTGGTPARGSNHVERVKDEILVPRYPNEGKEESAFGLLLARGGGGGGGGGGAWVLGRRRNLGEIKRSCKTE